LARRGCGFTCASACRPRDILFYEEFSIKEMAVACGFSYPAVFSRARNQRVHSS
jgi:transcriptional regulator GlxA family with amidase domain